MATIINVKLPLSTNEGPYTVVGERVDGDNIATFAVDVRNEGDPVACWEEIPIPKPLLCSIELARLVTDKISALGFELVSSNPTVH